MALNVPEDNGCLTSELPRNGGAGAKVLMLDDNPALCGVLAKHLGEVLKERFVWQKMNDADFLSVVGEIKPDVLVMDPCELNLRFDKDLGDTVRALSRVSVFTKVLGYSSRMDEAMLRAAINAKFAGCVGKGSDLRQLEVAMWAILSGGIYFDSSYAPFFHNICGVDFSLSYSLSNREREVIIRTARGHAAKQIANDLSISAKTVETYKSRALQKLGLTSRADLVDHAISQGWLS